VHGLAGSARWWHATEDAFRGRRRVVALDLPGFGSERRARFALDDAPAHVAFRLEEVGRAHLIGHSLGGLVAARVAARRPDLVDRLVLVAPAGALPRRSLPAHALQLAHALRHTSPQFARLLFGDALRGGPRTLWQAARDLLDDDVVPELEQIHAPTLLVWGSHDPLVPPALGELFRGAIPNAELVLVEGARHVPMLERPAEFATLVDEFLT